MKLELIEYTCATCGLVFEAPGTSENAYGEFLLRSQGGSVAFLNAIKDPTYKEVESLLTPEPGIAALPPLDRAKILRHVYGPLACDPDDGMMPFEIDARPACPHCNANAVSSWRFKSPPAFIDIAVPPVSHAGWEKLSEAAKLNRLKVQLAETIQ